MSSTRFTGANVALTCVLVLALLSSTFPALAQDTNQESDKIFLPLIAGEEELTQSETQNGSGPQELYNAPIRLQSATFVPDHSTAATAGGNDAAYAPNPGGYYIVQFQGPVQQIWKDEVTGLGGELLGYIPDFAFKVHMNPARAAKVAKLDSVTWVGIYQPQYKLSPELEREGTNLYRVRVERGADAGLATANIVRTGARILERSENSLLVAADSAQLDEIALVLDVASVENYVLPEKHNEYGAGVIMGANQANANGYDGSSQIAAVADTGLGDGTVAGAHPDIPLGRIVDIHNWIGSTGTCFQEIFDDGAIDVDSGHGTHTAVSVLGDGGVNGEGKGAAPAAALVFQAIENWAIISSICQLLGGWSANGYFLTGLPVDLHDLYQQAYNDGARIHSNSWGAAVAGDYTADSANTDDFVWNNPDMTITFSSGNSGADTNSDGVVDTNSIGSPATAKNVITVGASENDRQEDYSCDTSLSYTSHDAYQPGETCGNMGGVNLLGTAGPRWGFPAEPLFSDPTAGNADQMAPFSSRGPTDDGRIKPDVVAPGSWVLSGFSGVYQEGYGDPLNAQNDEYQSDGWGMPANLAYKYMGGTSMSNPLVAGAATVVRDYYQKARSHSASAALVKATLINSAVDLLDENNDGANDNDFPIPNFHEGWGRVNLADATLGNHLFEDSAEPLSTGGSTEYQYNIIGAGSSFKVTLVWSDYPSTDVAAQNLVNDLDLIVTAPGGTQYRGNVFSGGWSQSAGSADRANNVENVYVQSAAQGTWTVQVSGFNVPIGPQPFALVVDGEFGLVDSPPGVTITDPADGATITGPVDITADAGDDNGVTQVEFFVDGGSIATDTDGTNGWSYNWETTDYADGLHTVSATATDTIDQTRSDSIDVTVDNVNDPPLASFFFTCAKLSCNFDASGSSDSDGTLTSYDWNFGDGSSETGVAASHSYATAGTYPVTLTVTDDSGNTDTHMQDVTVDNVNDPPVAGFTDDCTLLACDFDASASNDSDGSITDYDWNFGDSGSGNGVTASHSYTAAGIYPVMLTVTDDSGNTGSHTRDITVSDANDVPVAGFYYVCVYPLCTFNASESNDPDGSIDSYDWVFGDGTSGSGVMPLHSYSAPGNYEVQLTVTDDGGMTDTDMQMIGLDEQFAFHVADLDGSSIDAARSRWDARVTITLHDSNEQPFVAATVAGFWSDDSSQEVTCDTNSETGQCTITKGGLKQNVDSVEFSVSDVRGGSWPYDADRNHDPDGGSDGTTIAVNRSVGNTPPVTTITQPTAGAEAALSGSSTSFAGSASDSEDGDLTASLVWTSSINGQIGTGGSFSYALTDGVHSVTATATDSVGATGSDSISITIGDPPPPAAMHVGSVSAVTSKAKRRRWNTTVTITVHDPDDNPIAKATVNGSWSTGASGTGSCTTDGGGTCSINKNNINKNSASVKFAIDGVLHASNTYVPGSNHNPTPDGDGVTAITIVKP